MRSLFVYIPMLEVTLYPTGCFTLIILCTIFIKNLQRIIKHHMINSLKTKQIHNFICVSVIICTDLKVQPRSRKFLLFGCSIHIRLVNDEFRNKACHAQTVSPCRGNLPQALKKARYIACTYGGPVTSQGSLLHSLSIFRHVLVRSITTVFPT